MENAHVPMTKDDPRYITFCPACNEAVDQGLEFEETHASQYEGTLDTEDGYIPSFHCNNPDNSFKDYSFTPLNNLNGEELIEVYKEWAGEPDYIDDDHFPPRSRFDYVDLILADKYRQFSIMPRAKLIRCIKRVCYASNHEVMYSKRLGAGDLLYDEMTETEIHLRLIIFSELALSATAYIDNYINREAIDE